MAALAERKAASVVAAACADAAAQPLHWIYKQDELDELLKERDEVEFWEPSANPFYRIKVGRNTCYGDQSFVLLQSLVANKGLNKADLVGRYYQHFGPGSEYEDKRNKEYSSHEEAKYHWKGPIDRPWKNGSIKHFIKNVEAKNAETGSADDKQMDGITKIAPVVAMYAGRDNCMEKVEEAVRVTQNDDMTVAITLVAARILEKAILYGREKTLKEITEEVLAKLGDAQNPDRHELDANMAGLVRQALDSCVHSHLKVASDVFVKS